MRLDAPEEGGGDAHVVGSNRLHPAHVRRRRLLHRALLLGDELLLRLLVLLDLTLKFLDLSLHSLDAALRIVRVAVRGRGGVVVRAAVVAAIVVVVIGLVVVVATAVAAGPLGPASGGGWVVGGCRPRRRAVRRGCARSGAVVGLDVLASPEPFELLPLRPELLLQLRLVAA